MQLHAAKNNIAAEAISYFACQLLSLNSHQNKNNTGSQIFDDWFDEGDYWEGK